MLSIWSATDTSVYGRIGMNASTSSSPARCADTMGASANPLA